MEHPLTGAIDCDIHPAVPTTRALLPHLDPYWREHILRRGLERENLELSAYPSTAPINGRPDWRLPSGPPGSSLAALQAHLLDRMQLRFAICNVLNGAQAMFSEVKHSVISLAASSAFLDGRSANLRMADRASWTIPFMTEFMSLQAPHVGAWP